jgi:hypothetical protein
MVDRLGSLTRAIATLRKNLGKAGEAGAKQATAGKQRRAQEHGLPVAVSHVAALASRLAVLKRDDPQRARKALRLFIEAVLLDEFGEELILGVEFERLVDRTLIALQADSAMQEMLAEGIGELLR